LILASASPQRRAILADAGIHFEVRPADVDEDEEGDPRAVAEGNARRKAEAVPGELVLGADTVVALDGAILGKPRDAAQAREYVGRLNGRTHEVVGGIALARDGVVVASAVEVTRVTFRRSDDATLDRYVATGEWQGRAGGYAIQGEGRALVERVEGDYLNVVGLAWDRVKRLLDSR
jgi:septum formation protein